MNLTNLKMMLQGFKKVALNDSKGVLNKSNNSKWVKNAENSKYTVLPSGTMIEEGKGVSGCDYKKIIKPNGRMVVAQHNLPNAKTLEPVKGSYAINEYEKCVNIGSNSRPNYLPSGAKKVYKQKTPEEVIAENNAKKETTVKEKRTQKRLKFIEEFKQKYDRKDIKGSDGSRSKYVIDKETGDIVSFWRKDANGKVMHGKTDNFGVCRDMTLVDSNNNMYARTVSNLGVGKKGRYIEKTKISADGELHENYITTSKGKKIPQNPASF